MKTRNYKAGLVANQLWWNTLSSFIDSLKFELILVIKQDHCVHQTRHCGNVRAIRSKLCPQCKGEFPLSKKRQAIGPPKSCPYNLISIMLRKVCITNEVFKLTNTRLVPFVHKWDQRVDRNLH